MLEILSVNSKLIGLAYIIRYVFIFLPDIRDNSGVRLTYTPDLRRYDAGILSLGHPASGFTLVVPPHLDSFQVEGGCSAECLGGVSWNRVLHKLLVANCTSLA